MAMSFCAGCGTYRNRRRACGGVRRVLLFAALVFGTWPAGSALAATTVGQTGTPLNNVLFGPGRELAQNDAAMPSAGVATSFHTQSSSSCTMGEYDFQVLRPLGANQYRVLGDTGNKTDPCDGMLHSYSVNIPVQAGDVLGFYVVNMWQGVLSTTSGSENNASMSEPAVGDTVTLPTPATVTVDESATLVTAPSAQISSPGNNQTFGLNQSVQATFSCTEDSGGPGIQSCADSHGTSGTTGTLHGTLDTSTAGAHTYTVTATSKDGLTAKASIAYNVIAPPVTAPPVSIKSAKIDDNHQTAKFNFEAVGNATGFQCALAKRKRSGKYAKPSFSACRSPKRYKHLKPGAYKFEVRSMSAAVQGLPASKRFTIT